MTDNCVYPQALSDFLDSIHAWGRALDTLPKENLSPTEAKQKVQYQEGLKNAHAAKSAAITEPSRRGIHISQLNGKMPWTIAEEMLSELRATQNIASSVRVVSAHRLLINTESVPLQAWVIWGAYDVRDRVFLLNLISEFYLRRSLKEARPP